jgi:pimeloyl-ACP methyl ester carboxylesterase
MPFMALAAATLAQAPVERYELGLRLRDFERSLAACKSPDLRAGALRELDRAVQAFFRLDQRGVAQAIGRASAALHPAPPTANERFATSLQLSLETRLVAPTAAVPWQLSRAFGDESIPSGVHLEIQVVGAATPPIQVPITDLPIRGALPLANTTPGDGGVEWRIRVDDAALAPRWHGLSVAEDLTGRLGRLAEAADRCEDIPARTRTLEQATLVALVEMLKGMTRRRPEETTLPGARLLDEAEALAKSLAANAPHYTARSTGQHWLRVPLASGTSALRFAAPTVPTGERRPIVVALHGAGGSENLFFDGYGDGLVARLAADRGWFVAAPRLGGLFNVDVPGLVAALATRWPIDQERVFLVGHSMGAAQAVAIGSRQPARFRAVAALGGGGAVARRQELATLPFFVGVGERDFARSGALQLHRQLGAASAPSTLREYPDVEHLAIVQLALPDVFTFFDAALARR